MISRLWNFKISKVDHSATLSEAAVHRCSSKQGSKVSLLQYLSKFLVRRTFVLTLTRPSTWLSTFFKADNKEGISRHVKSF